MPYKKTWIGRFDRFCRWFTPQDDGCWNWTGGLMGKDYRAGGGYGSFWDGNKYTAAHRYGYEAMVGPIPAGLTLDHLCRNRLCVNPDHLEPVSNRENILRGINPAAKAARQTHCVRGHALTPENLDTFAKVQNQRQCKLCRRIRNAAYYWRHKEESRAVS